MRLQPGAVEASAHRTDNPRRPVRLVFGADLAFDMSRPEAVALADALIDATEQETA